MKYVVNTDIEFDPLSENNLDKTLLIISQELENNNSDIWLYTYYSIEKIFPRVLQIHLSQYEIKRQEVVRQCSVLVDRFGDKDCRVIDVKNTVKTGKVHLWEGENDAIPN